MNINYKQPQFELFPANSATLDDTNKPKFLLANLTLSVESLVILTILGIMVAIFSFSLGVERGKHVAAQALDERVSAAWNVGARTVAPVVVPAVLIEKSVVEQRPGSIHGYLSLNIHRFLSGNMPSTGMGNRFTLQAATYGNE